MNQLVYECNFGIPETGLEFIFFFSCKRNTNQFYSGQN